MNQKEQAAERLRLAERAFQRAQIAFTIGDDEATRSVYRQAILEIRLAEEWANSVLTVSSVGLPNETVDDLVAQS